MSTTVEYTIDHRFKTNMLPYLKVDITDDTCDQSSRLVLSITDAIRIITDWYENNSVSVFSGGYKFLSSICWYDDNPTKNAVLSIGDEGMHSYWLDWDQGSNLIEAMRSYIAHCTDIINGKL